MPDGRLLLVVALGSLFACASVAPPKPRFVAVFEQRSPLCRIQVLLDTRTSGCWIAFRCSRQPITVLAVDDKVCVP
jgi:hypothetical protein